MLKLKTNKVTSKTCPPKHSFLNDTSQPYSTPVCTKRKNLGSFLFLFLQFPQNRKNSTCHRQNTALYIVALSRTRRTVCSFRRLSFKKMDCPFILLKLPRSLRVLTYVYHSTTNSKYRLHLSVFCRQLRNHLQ